jgi:sugar phosphate permease
MTQTLRAQKLSQKHSVLMEKPHKREWSIMSSVAQSQLQDSTASVETRKTRRRWLVAVILLCLVVTGYFDRISVAVLFTDTDFQTAMGTGFSPALLGMLMTGFFIPYGIASIVLSFTGDTFGPRRMLIAGSAVWALLCSSWAV